MIKIEKLKKSKYFERIDSDNFEKTAELYFKINSETEISIKFKNLKINNVILHITDFSTKSTDLHFKKFKLFKNLFEALTLNVFDIDCL
jgi:hypothetical protein